MSFRPRATTIFIVVVVVVVVAMVEHQSDVTAVEYPDYTDDAGETLDLVVRKGPISLRDLMRQISAYAEDTVHDHLLKLERDGYVDRVEGDLEEHGTTRDVWYVSKND